MFLQYLLGKKLVFLYIDPMKFSSIECLPSVSYPRISTSIRIRIGKKEKLDTSDTLLIVLSPFSNSSRTRSINTPTHPPRASYHTKIDLNASVSASKRYIYKWMRAIWIQEARAQSSSFNSGGGDAAPSQSGDAHRIRTTLDPAFVNTAT